MTVTLRCPTSVFEEARAELADQAEVVGFFLADFQPDRAFVIRDWRAIRTEGYAWRTDYHVTLTDEAATEMIQWASREGASLVEAHSHKEQPASFSPSDLAGFVDWVPHLSWRLGRRPYGALVLAGATIDGLAWVDDPSQPERVDRIELDHGSLEFTGLSPLHPRLGGGVS